MGIVFCRGALRYECFRSMGFSWIYSVLGPAGRLDTPIQKPSAFHARGGRGLRPALSSDSTPPWGQGRGGRRTGQPARIPGDHRPAPPPAASGAAERPAGQRSDQDGQQSDQDGQRSSRRPAGAAEGQRSDQDGQQEQRRASGAAGGQRGGRRPAEQQRASRSGGGPAGAADGQRSARGPAGQQTASRSGRRPAGAADT